MSVKLLTKHNLEFLSLKGGFTGSSESTLIKMPHCWKSHATAQISIYPRETIQLVSFSCLFHLFYEIHINTADIIFPCCNIMQVHFMAVL